MKSQKIASLIFSIFILLTCLGCSSPTSSNTEGNSIYYWRTTFTLNDAERKFLKEHNVSKIYVRFFDVGRHWEPGKGTSVTPDATISFIDSIPDGIEIVPTIYITISAIEDIQPNEYIYAEKIYKRINAICRQNNILFNEIQLDCDWTKGTREPFFSLCEALKSCQDSTQILSSTIRLHQLIQTPPPVDKGVLMVYNTGNLMEMTTDNSIFSRRDIGPYLRDNRLAKYDLPLDVAYPTYGWSVVYSQGEEKYYFNRLMRRTDLSGYDGLRKISSNTYEATKKVDFNPGGERWDGVYKDDRIRVERPTASEILEVKALIEKQLNDKPHSNILYHLDETQFKHYSDNEINQIYSHN